MVFTEESQPASSPAGAGSDRGATDYPTVEDVVSAFVAVMGRIGQHFFQRSAEFDLSPQQAKAFHELRHPLSMGELAERLLCDASNVTGIVDRLEARGLVERQPDPDDRRVRRLVLTAEGRELWKVHHARVFDGVPCVDNLTDDERGTLCELLARMASAPTPDADADA